MSAPAVVPLLSPTLRDRAIEVLDALAFGFTPPPPHKCDTCRDTRSGRCPACRESAAMVMAVLAALSEVEGASTEAEALEVYTRAVLGLIGAEGNGR